MGTGECPAVLRRRRRQRDDDDDPLNESLIAFFRAGLQDRIGLRRQLGAQLSFSAHFSHCSALQLHLVAQQLSQLRRRVTTLASVFNFF